jgi:hypothetical protein
MRTDLEYVMELERQKQELLERIKKLEHELGVERLRRRRLEWEILDEEQFDHYEE